MVEKEVTTVAKCSFAGFEVAVVWKIRPRIRSDCARLSLLGESRRSAASNRLVAASNCPASKYARPSSRYNFAVGLAAGLAARLQADAGTV